MKKLNVRVARNGFGRTICKKLGSKRTFVNVAPKLYLLGSMRLIGGKAIVRSILKITYLKKAGMLGEAQREWKNRKGGGNIMINQYGCVKCQKPHYEDEKVYNKHIMHQSKHGIEAKPDHRVKPYVEPMFQGDNLVDPVLARVISRIDFYESQLADLYQKRGGRVEYSATSRKPKRAWCVGCGKNEVSISSVYDTCNACLQNI